jgi:hypothetical protein
MKHLIFWILISITLAGCATNPLHSSASGLKTRITDDGLKLFELKFPEAPTKLDLRQRTYGQEAAPSLTSEQMAKYLEAVMGESFFCRKGYKLLGRYAGETTHSLRGECNDKATATDRKTYPDTITHW